MTIKQTPVKITIPTPMYSPRQRGPYALNTLGENLRVRFSRVEHEQVKQAADELEMPISDFIRWCATYAAKEIIGTS